MGAWARVLRKVVRIDEDRCNGCGVCVPACAEGALRIVDGKARLVSDRYCDGLGACLGECPEGAITIEEREAEAFDEPAAPVHGGDAGRHGPAGRHEVSRMGDDAGRDAASPRLAEESLPCGCPSSSVTRLERHETGERARAEAPGCRVVAADLRGGAADECCRGGTGLSPQLSHWPVQLTLVPPGAPFLRGADVVLTADCVPFAYAGFHQDFLKDHAVMVACPKLDDFQAHLAKLTEVLRRSGIRSITVVRMEVPCCSGLTRLAREAARQAGQTIPIEEAVIGIRGERQA